MTRVLTVFAALLVTVPLGSQPPRTTRPGTRPTNPAPPAKDMPRLMPLAENKLVMEGLTNANFLGLEKILKSGAVDEESWTFARGQALLIAESGNLLMIRPPNNPNESTWIKSAAEMRDSASQLAKVVATRDVERSRSALIELSQKCNACHEGFRIKTRVKPFAE